MTTTTIHHPSRTTHRPALIGLAAAIAAALVLTVAITIDRSSSTDPTPDILVFDGLTLTATDAVQGLVAGAVGTLGAAATNPVVTTAAVQGLVAGAVGTLGAVATTPVLTTAAVQGLVAGAVGNLTGR